MREAALRTIRSRLSMPTRSPLDFIMMLVILVVYDVDMTSIVPTEGEQPCP
jgi:hypothetical protein